MPTRPRSWLPLTLGVSAALIGLILLRELLYVPSGQGEFLFLGWVLTGNAAWAAAALQVAFLLAIAYGSLTYRRAVVWPIVVYCGYWIASVWIWSWSQLTYQTMTLAVTCGLVTVLLLVLCRTVLGHREDFDA